MSCACVYAHQLMQQEPGNRGPERMADLFCRHSRRRVKQLFRDVWGPDDAVTYRVAQEVLQGRHAWMDPELLV
jgi:hypothetical protein